jgi:hypothetical protein
LNDHPVKTCAKCRVSKPYGAFHRQPGGRYGRHSYCAGCANELQRESRTRNYSHDQKRKWQLKTRYGITPADVARMLEEQASRCAICLAAFEKFHVDHSHETGEVRGLLCHRCNIRLGGWDDPTWRAAAIKYLGWEA